MHITLSDFILMAHAGFGGLGCLAAIWVFVDALNATESNATRIRKAALIAAVCMAAAWILGGDWYVTYYPAEKAMILKGQWPLAHDLFMETKEHLFFVTAILAFLLPIATREKLYANRVARKLVLSVAVLISVTGLAVEGAGAVIDHGAKVELLRGPVKGEAK